MKTWVETTLMYVLINVLLSFFIWLLHYNCFIIIISSSSSSSGGGGIC